MSDIITAERAQEPATLAEAEAILCYNGVGCGYVMSVRLARSVIALHAELARLRKEMDVDGERSARICEALHRRGVFPEKWPDYFRVRAAGDAMLAARAPTTAQGDKT